MGMSRKNGFLGSGPIPSVKVKDKIYNQHFNKHDARTTIPNFKLFSGSKIIKGVVFMLKRLTNFKTMSDFPFFEHILKLNHCRVFETKTTFPLY